MLILPQISNSRSFYPPVTGWSQALPLLCLHPPMSLFTVLVQCSDPPTVSAPQTLPGVSGPLRLPYWQGDRDTALLSPPRLTSPLRFAQGFYSLLLPQSSCHYLTQHVPLSQPSLGLAAGLPAEYLHLYPWPTSQRAGCSQHFGRALKGFYPCPATPPLKLASTVILRIN